MVRDSGAQGRDRGLKAVLMRGGTSKAVFFRESALPTDTAERETLILGVYGSPDPYSRQTDGLGGATSLTSKVAIIDDGASKGCDVSYTFGQVGIDKAIIDWNGNCGNISSAVGPYAVDEGLVVATDPVTSVRIFNTNTSKVIVAQVPTSDGRFDPRGDLAIPGVPGTGAPIRLDYLDPSGAVTGKLLPTGSARDVVDVPGVGVIEVSIVDAANPLAFVRWEDVGLTGTETADELASDPELLARLQAVRGAAAVIAGIATSPEDAAERTPSVPKLALVGAPLDYVLSNGEAVPAESISLRIAMMSMGKPHTSIALTGAICTAVACAIPGTLPAELASHDLNGRLRLGHQAGVLNMEARPEIVDSELVFPYVSVYRTARRLFEGIAFPP